MTTGGLISANFGAEVSEFGQLPQMRSLFETQALLVAGVRVVPCRQFFVNGGAHRAGSTS